MEAGRRGQPRKQIPDLGEDGRTSARLVEEPERACLPAGGESRQHANAAGRGIVHRRQQRAVRTHRPSGQALVAPEWSRVDQVDLDRTPPAGGRGRPSDGQGRAELDGVGEQGRHGNHNGVGVMDGPIGADRHAVTLLSDPPDRLVQQDAVA